MAENIKKTLLHIPTNFRAYPDLAEMLHTATQKERERMANDIKYAGRDIYAPPIGSKLWKYDETKKVWRKASLYANQDQSDSTKYYYTIEIKTSREKPREAIEQDERRKQKAASSNAYRQAKDGEGFNQREIEQKPTPPVFEDDLDF
tara:strand:- start:1194 stop:1634 length:441 start_codon:yes stop_codon:yes gene_type:complete